MLDDIRKNTYKIRWSKSVVLLIHCVVFFFFNILLDKVSRTNRQTFAITPMKSMLLCCIIKLSSSILKKVKCKSTDCFHICNAIATVIF